MITTNYINKSKYYIYIYIHNKLPIFKALHLLLINPGNNHFLANFTVNLVDTRLHTLSSQDFSAATCPCKASFSHVKARFSLLIYLFCY